MPLTKTRDIFGAAADDHAACIGCGVCTLSCPVWQQRRARELTFCGRARLVLENADDELLARSAGACILCGSCEALCPLGIPALRATIGLRQRLARHRSTNVRPGAPADRGKKAPSKRLFLPGDAMRKNVPLLARCVKLLGGKGEGVRCADDDGTGIVRALEAGERIEPEQLDGFLASLRGAKEIIATDGLMVNVLSRMLDRKVTVRGLGPALLELEAVRAGVGPGDLYLIETRAYNARREEQAMLYETLRRERGCFMNLDLHRVATPTGMMGRRHRAGLPPAVSVEAQVRWILEGRNADRVVVEHPEDGMAFGSIAGLRVAHLAEAAGT